MSNDAIVIVGKVGYEIRAANSVRIVGETSGSHVAAAARIRCVNDSISSAPLQFENEISEACLVAIAELLYGSTCKAEIFLELIEVLYCSAVETRLHDVLDRCGMMCKVPFHLH